MSKILDFVESALKEDADLMDEFCFGTMPPFQGQALAITTGINSAGARKMINAYGIVHAIKRHGDNSKEGSLVPPQVGLKNSDFELIPSILSSPDMVVKGKDTNRGNPVMKFSKKIKGHTYVVVMTLFKGGRKGPKLEFDTMYIIK